MTSTFSEAILSREVCADLGRAFFIPPLCAERVAWKCSFCLLTGNMPYNPSTELCSSPSRHIIIKRQQTSWSTILMLQSHNLVLENFPP